MYYNKEVFGDPFFMSFSGTIEHDGEKVKMVGQYSARNAITEEVTLDQVRPKIEDPLKK